MENKKVFHKTEKALEYVLSNKSLIEGKIPEISDDLGNRPRTDSAIHGADNPEAANVFTGAANLYYHADVFTLGRPITITYDIGFETSLDGFALIGYDAPYQVMEFELYASLQKETLYKEENKCAHFVNEYVIEHAKKARRDKNWNDGQDIVMLLSVKKARYFGIKIIKANQKDSIFRAVRFCLFSNEYTKKILEQDKKYEYNLSVDTSEVINNNFYSLGGNIIPCHLMPEQFECGYTREYFEVEKSQLKHLKLGVTRLWFQLDWITDNEENYKNCVYTFDSVKFEAFCEYVEALKKAGTEVELNFGWKTDTTISEWFSKKTAPEDKKTSAAPENLELFAKACAATLKELLDNRGLTNVKYLTFYNEPSPARDFGTHSSWNDNKDFIENVKYWYDMVCEVDKELKRQGLRDKIELWGPENAPGRAKNHILAFTHALEQMGDSPLDVLTYHHYNYFSYEFPYTRPAQIEMFQDKPIVITEYAEYRRCFDNNCIQMFIDCANYGYAGYLYWCGSTSVIPSPLNITIGGTHAERVNLIRTQTSNVIKTLSDGVGAVGTRWSEVSMCTNYVPVHSKVLKTATDGKDMRIAAFITPSGDYTVIVEANHSICDRTLKIEFDKSINSKFYCHKYSRKYSFRDEIINDLNGVVPPVSDMINVTDTLEYKVDSNYNVLCFTTMPPVPQVVIADVNPFILPGESFKLSATILDAEGEIEWSYISGAGTVDDQGVVTLSEDAKSGDMVAVKAGLKGTDIYSVAVVQCCF